MRKPDWFRRARPAIEPDEAPLFDMTALAFAMWLGLLVGVRFIELLPPMPPMPAASVPTDAWAMAAFGT